MLWLLYMVVTGHAVGDVCGLVGSGILVEENIQKNLAKSLYIGSGTLIE